MATHQIETAIDIDAPPSRVWAVLTDLASYPSWNPFIRSVRGPLKQGGRLLVEIKPPGSRLMTFQPTITALAPERELRWRGKLLIPRLFDGEHSFVLHTTEGDRTTFLHAETFSGLLVGSFAKRGMLDRTREGFDLMNLALKERVEGVV